MIFKDRVEAAELLVEKLQESLADLQDKKLTVLGIPRGAMPMARIIADKLGGDLDVVLVHKIPAPMQPELAIGSVGVSGEAYRDPAIEGWGISERYIQQEAENQVRLLKQRRTAYGLPETGPDLTDRNVIIVDDGIATGSTMMGAIHEVRAGNPNRVIVAAAVASREATDLLRQAADELVLLHQPELFMAVGNFFQDFSQVSDEEAIELLQSFAKPNATQPRPVQDPSP